MREALRQALEIIEIDNPYPPAIARDVEIKYREFQERCLIPPDKFRFLSAPNDVTLANLNEDDLQLS